MSQPNANVYYVPHNSRWPIIATLGMFLFMVGAAVWLNGYDTPGKIILTIGALSIIGMMFGWFGNVIHESMKGTFNSQVDTSFRMGMTWFIFSEVFFFAAFFGGLFYIRTFVVPWLGGVGDKGVITNGFIWQGFSATWPTNGPEAVGGSFTSGSPWGIPLLNTLLLLSSSVTVTIAHHALRAGNRKKLIGFLGLTILLGITFLCCQAYEYWESYVHLNMTLHSGIYGATFYILTGFHGLHVTLGTIMLIVMWLRSVRGHFTPQNHFAFEAVSWYWHFVDVIWLCLFLFVYIL
ncbi:MAG: cytochrome c oxidase subunit 3 [Xanthomonadales bacterium]|nr:cytochrome c oxidase subunit 3 [Xanthomonadales bacterium]ODU93187.1 MAG: MFS transporter [Rhodanobacter sp. SCN 66-43]OJY82090.1 MAG: cytochrome c oxidase subunit 3 [Xanthomonadales bacterium 66-474]